MSIQTLPEGLIRHIAEYLPARDFLRLGSCCLRLQEILKITMKRRAYTKISEDLQNSNMLYCQFELDRFVDDSILGMNLLLMRFAFETKDQGWVSSPDSCSWIEAEFEDVAGNSLINHKQSNETDSHRLPLVWNYQVLSYENKFKFVDAEMLLKDTHKIRIYLRSKRPRNVISCKSAEIALYYGGTGSQLTEKQLKEELVIKKRKPRRRI